LGWQLAMEGWPRVQVFNSSRASLRGAGNGNFAGFAGFQFRTMRLKQSAGCRLN